MSRESLIPEGLIEKIDPLIGEPYRMSVSTGLADAFSSLITEQINLPTVTQKKVKPIVKIVEDATLFTPSSKELQDGWKILLEEMQPSESTPEALRKKLLSFFLADQLLYQTSQQPNKRASIRHPQTQNLSVTRLGIASLFLLNPQEAPDTLHKKVEKVMEDIRKSIDKTLDKKPKDLNTIREQFEAIHTVLDATSSTAYQGWTEYLNPLTVNWVDQIGNKSDELVENPYCLELLLEEKLETISPILKFGIWYYPWISGKITDGKKTTDSKKVALLDYFLTNKSLQSHFWLDDDILYSSVDKDDEPESAVQPILDWVFKQASEKIEAFFETLPLDEYKYNKLNLIQLLMGLYGISQSRSLDINKETVTKSISSLMEKAGLRSKLTIELDIIENRTPGLLYLEPEKFEARVKFPRRDQTKDHLLAEMDRRKLRVIYISEAQWNGHKIMAETPFRSAPEAILLKASLQMNSERWGKIGIISQNDLPSILNLMSVNLGFEVKEETAFNTLVEWDDKAHLQTLEKPYIVIPSLLSLDNPIYRLQKSGILAIEQEADNITFIIEPTALNLETETKRLAFLAKLADRELNIPYTSSNFTSSPLFYLMNAAILLGRVPTNDGPITKEESREIHTSMKYWNQNALKEARPILFSEYDRNNPLVWAKRAACLVGDKVAFLACY